MEQRFLPAMPDGHVLRRPSIPASSVDARSWEASVPETMLTARIDGHGTFGPWQVTTGGSGATIRMVVPFPTATVVCNGISVACTDGMAHVEVDLDHPVVVVSSVTYRSILRNAAMNDALKHLLQGWFNDNLVQFAHVLSAEGRSKGDVAA